MDLNELQSVQSRERQTDSLQQLRATFYRDAADYIADLESERDAAAERADDPWNAPEVGRLNDDIDTAEDTVEAIYERRVGKIVEMASFAAADMPTDDEGLTEEEQALFDRLVSAIEENREGVFAILDGEDPPVDPTDAEAADARAPATGPSDGSVADSAGATPDAAGSTAEAGGPDDVPPGTAGAPDQSAGEPTATPEGGVDAADLMVGGPSDPPGDAGPGAERASEPDDTGQPVRDGGTETETQAETATPSETAPPAPSGRTGEPRHGSSPGPDSAGSDAATGSDSSTGAGAESVDRSMVRITDDVGPIYGVEGREYELTENDVVTLPEPNVGPLLKKGAAERID
jgi:DNA replication factor GINS